MFKRFLFILLGLSLFGFGCQQTSIEEQVATSPDVETVEENVSLEETVYTTFVINTHDWVNPELSIDTLNRVIDLHEKYELPVDIYLDDQVVQIYEEQSPELLERLKTSPYVAVSFHIRPPSPYFGGFDWLGLDKMNNRELSATLKKYEEHKIDLATGESLDEVGGYEHLKNLLGYAPYVVSVVGNNQKVSQALGKVYQEKGAQLAAVHSDLSLSFGNKQNDLWIRPENFEVKVYEPRGRKAGEQFLIEALDEVKDLKTSFVNLKWHENNFYTWYTPWSLVYFTDQDKTQALQPPFDLSKAGDGSKMKTEEEQEEQWQRYEECLIYTKEHSEIFTVVNARDLLKIIQ